MSCKGHCRFSEERVRKERSTLGSCYKNNRVYCRRCEAWLIRRPVRPGQDQDRNSNYSKVRINAEGRDRTHCPCCGYSLRLKPRSKHSKDLLQPQPRRVEA